MKITNTYRRQGLLLKGQGSFIEWSVNNKEFDYFPLKPRVRLAPACIAQNYTNKIGKL